ncbi:Lrp/AsnC family transcriptional regulator [uncultured Croceitalea sp.]|uniref:Lrp/AsnC family transcriptional regulator n=1 Tax=uncultured Croceitalea sp. TaxID=1798908 RepID=UPI00374F1F4A
MVLDEIDKKLLALLQADSKKTTKAYAMSLNLSTTAVYERIRKLEREGVITDYVALVDKKKINRDFTILCQVRLSQHTKDNILRFERQVQQLNEVSECNHVSGDYDYMLTIHVSDMTAYREFMINKLTAIDQIGSTQSSFVINPVKKSTAIFI